MKDFSFFIKAQKNGS